MNMVLVVVVADDDFVPILVTIMVYTVIPYNPL